MSSSLLRATSVAVLFIVPKLATAASPEKRGLEIAVMSDKANEGFKGERSEMTMELINAHGDITTRKLTIEIFEGQGDGDKSKSSFLWPTDVKGTQLLTWTHKEGDDDQWLYLPAIKRVKRISSRNKSGSFMGSEFSFEDFGSQEVEKYTYKFLEETKEQGRDCWRSERYPVDKRSGYKRQIVWTDKEYLNVIRVDYYDRKDELLKVGTFVDYKKYGKFWRFGKIEMNNVQTKKKSIITWKKRQLNIDFDEDDFESDALEE